jgi:DNA-binding NtrC family response regulator
MLERTLIVVKNAIEAKRLRTENVEFRRQLSLEQQITGESVQARALRQQIKLMAPTNGRVLIYGESGSGKELIARAIHAESLRSDRVFVELNCAAIPEDYIESELFGYRNSAISRGASGEARHVRTGQRRHAFSGRSGRHEPEDPGQGAARARRAALRAGGRAAGHQRGRARDRGDQ